MGTKFGSDASLFLQASENWCHVTHCVRAFLRRVRLWLVAPGGGDAKNEACPFATKTNTTSFSTRSFCP